MIRILGLGDNVVDKYVHTRVMYPGGNAFNIAALGALSGVRTAYMGVFGDDEAGCHVRRTAAELGIDTWMCRVYSGENGYAEVRLDEGDRVFVGSNKGGVSRVHPMVLNRMDEEYIAEFDVCHTSIFSYTEDQLPVIRRVSPFVSMDFSDSYDDAYLRRCCPYIDMAEISCGNRPREEIVAEMEKIRSYGCRQIVLATRGSKGVFVMVNGRFYEQSPFLVEAEDTMAAGDSFITSFLIHYIDGMKCAVDFPEASGRRGITEKEAYRDVLVQGALYRAAIFAADNCMRDGSFGFGKSF